MSVEVQIEKAYKSFSLSVGFSSHGDTIGILGSSGSGKSLTLKCIAGLVKPDSGTIRIGDKVLFDSDRGINLSPAERSVGFIFQNYALFPHMTVKENVAFGIRKLPKKERINKVKTYLDHVQLSNMGDLYPAQLSGGQQQRVAIARAMITEPDILLLDEPFSALDQYLRHEMELLLKKILKAFNGVALFVSHDIHESYRISDEILIYQNGKIAKQGTKQEVFTMPASVEVARITGCKNIMKAKCERKGDYRVEGLGGKIRGMSEQRDLTHIGIRAHHIEVAGRESVKENVFECKIVECIESPFEVAVLLVCIEGGGKLRWELSREKWEKEAKGKEVLHICLPKDKIMLLSLSESK